PATKLRYSAKCKYAENRAKTPDSQFARIARACLPARRAATARGKIAATAEGCPLRRAAEQTRPAVAFGRLFRRRGRPADVFVEEREHLIEQRFDVFLLVEAMAFGAFVEPLVRDFALIEFAVQRFALQRRYAPIGAADGQHHVRLELVELRDRRA